MIHLQLLLLTCLVNVDRGMAWLGGPPKDFAAANWLRLRAGSGNVADAAADRDSPAAPWPALELSSATASPTRALVLMDCFCQYHGLYLAYKIQTDYPDVALIFTVSNYLGSYLRMTEPDEPRWQDARLPQNDMEMEVWKEKLHGLPIIGVYCESDSGLEDAERLREWLPVPCQDNPPQLPARRHKYFMNERVAKAGLETARQKLCYSLQEAQEFARNVLGTDWTTQAKATRQRMVVKPFRGVATESVHLCSSEDDVATAWNQIVATKVFGSSEQHSSVLVQEFLEGPEYAVDIVARNGEYKVAAIWKYDKRPANGAPFCYFRTSLVDCQSDGNAERIVAYVKSSLQALGVQWGLSHNEVIVTHDRGPVLVEINCRQHNMDFLPLVMACIGYNALDMTLVALLDSDDDDAWKGLPELPTLRAHGCMAHLVNFASGTVEQVRYLDSLSSLQSVVNWEVYEDFQPGESIAPTIDIRTDAGWVQLVHEDLKQYEDDYKTILDWMPTMFCVKDEGDDEDEGRGK